MLANNHMIIEQLEHSAKTAISQLADPIYNPQAVLIYLAIQTLKELQMINTALYTITEKLRRLDNVTTS